MARKNKSHEVYTGARADSAGKDLDPATKRRIASALADRVPKLEIARRFKVSIRRLDALAAEGTA